MKAMVLRNPGERLAEEDIPEPEPAADELLVRVSACAVCRTDIHIIDGELDEPSLPLVLGHQIVGTIAACGAGAQNFHPGQRVGIPWLGRTCGQCRFCRSDQENLCDASEFTGYTRPGGFAEMTVAAAQFAFPLPSRDVFDDMAAAPLLCAGLIGYRSYRMAAGSDEVRNLGFYGFGAAARILVQVARHDGRRVFALTRPGDTASQADARRLGAVWAGGSDEPPPETLDAAIIFAPAGALVLAALRAVRKAGAVVCAGIHMSDIPSFPYRDLWGERVIRSVANLTRRDAAEFLDLAPRIPIRTAAAAFPLAAANNAIAAVRNGSIHGSAVLLPD